MSINCANITSEEYKKLKAKFGEDKANYLWNKLNGTIPEDISKLVPIEFKKAQILMPYTIVKALKEAGIDHTKLTHQELKDMIDPDVLEGLAYRIPNQAAASNDAFEIVGILPENAGDTIIAFKEITTKTGSDFDIDKAYVMLPNFIYDKETGRFSTIKDDSKKGLQNERLRLSNLMLSNPKKYPQLMKPLDTDWAKTLILGNKDKNIEPLIKINKTVQDLNFWTGVTQTFNKAEFDNTKTLVGPIAKNMTNHNAIKHDGITYTNTYLGLGMFKTIEEETTIVEIPIMETQQETVSEPAGENQFSYKGKTIDTEFQLTTGQENALKQLIDFSQSDDKFITLQGYAGTGKTATIGYLAKYLEDKKFLYTAPTHAATAELAFATVKTGNKQFPMTIASSIKVAKNRETGVEETSFTRKFEDRLSYSGNILVVDELSMLSDKDLRGLQQALKNKSNVKVVFMGDPLQLPEVDRTNPEYKQISKAFSAVKQIILNEIKRTSNNDILNVLGNLRKKPDGSIPKTENTDKLKYLNSSEFNELLVNKFKEEPESTVLISYTNTGVAHSNQKIRESLGFTGSPKVGEVVTGYLGYSSKQVEKGNVANSIRYVISDIKRSGSKYEIEFTSSKLKILSDLGVKGVSETARATFLQLSSNDSFNFENLNEKDFEANNKIIADKMERLYLAKKDALKNPRYWDNYYRVQQDISSYFQNVNLGNTYIYNPATEKMELYTYNLHKGIDSDLKVEKGIDYGYAITVHKSQGSTIKNVFYDTNTLPSNAGSKLLNDKEEVGTEKGSLNYVAMSRASDLLVIKADDNSLFYPAENLLKDKKEESKQDNKIVTNNPKEFINYSGGAKGSDSEWEVIGAEYGIGKQVNYRPENLDNLKPEQLKEIETAYKKSVKELGRKFLSLTDPDSKKAYGAKLVRRDYLQAKAADSIFAIIEGFDKNNLPKGGTAYATMMAVDMKKPVHIFNQEDKTWYEAKYTEDGNFYGFEQSNSIPTLTPKFAGIGTREINDSGKQAIRDVYEKTFNNIESQKTAVGQPIQQSNKRTITTSKKESLVSTDIDEDGNSVEETLTGYMNAIVDGVKDPYIVKGNINLFTGGIAFMLARAGVSRNWISAFMVQPIMVDLVKQMNISESRISEISRDEKGETNKALDVILKKYGSQLTGADFKSDLTKDNLKNKEGDIKTTFEDLKRQLDNPNPAMQLKVLKQFFEFQDVSWKLSDLMTIMSADTDGATKNDITATMRDNLFHAVINNNTFTGLEKVLGYSKEENGEIKIDDTKYIGTFHKNSVQFFKKICKEQFITSSDSFKHAVYTIANYAGYSELKNKKHAEIITLIEQELFASFIEESKILSFDTIEELELNVIGPNKLIQRTNQQMAIEVNNQNKTLLENEGRILTDVERMSVMSPYLKKLEYLKSQKNLAQRVSDAQITYPDNLFLKSLLVDVNPYMNGKPSTIGLNSKNLNKDAKNTLYLYWEDLLNKDEKLAEDLIKYSFYASGLSNNFGAFFEHIPTNWLVKKGLNDFMNEKLQSLNESHTNLLHLQRQVMRHLHKDDRIVPTISDKIVTEFISPLGDIVPRQFYLTIPVFNANNLEIGTNNEDEKEYKKYIKRTIVDEMNDTKKSTMYELQGYINTLDSEGKPIKTLLYKVISPLGSKTKLGYVREYGNEKASIFSENITMLPANVKTFVDSLKKTDPKPIQILNSPIDKSFKKDDEMDENDPIFCAIK